MMKKIYGTITILILAAAMIDLTACANIVDTPQLKREAETGMVYIVINGNSAEDRAAARTLAPGPANFVRYWASFSGPEPQAEIEITGGGAGVNLVPGNWDITVTASTGTNPFYNEAGRGSATVTVVSDQTVTADITITPITGSGRNGDFRYSVAIPAVDSAALSLATMTTNTTVSAISIDLKAAVGGSAGTVADTLTDLDAGYYLVNIRLEKSGTYAGRTEVVHIYDGLETEAVYVFTDNDFGAVLGNLADGVWQDADMTVSGSEYYRFPVTAGASYAMYWNDGYQGDSTKTLDIKVSAYYETGGFFIFSNTDSGYNTPHVFTATSSGSVIIRVDPYSNGNTGTYAVIYGEVRPISADTAVPGDITSGGVKLYSFPATANMAYEVSWEDSGDQAGSSAYTGDITVTAYWGSIGSNILFSAVDSGYTEPREANCYYNTTIYFKVESVLSGTYSILVSNPPPTQYTITFDSQGGTAVGAISANEGTQAAKPSDPTKTGYTFTGWYSGAGWGTQYDWPYTMTRNITMYAAWTANTYTVAYDANGGNGTMMSSIHTYGMDKNLSANAFTRTGYTFAGWNTQADGEGTGYTGGQWVSNLASVQGTTVTLYAQWSVITYSISYEPNGGTNDPGNPASYSAENLPLPLVAPVRTGYTFGGWYENRYMSGSEAVTIPAGSTGNKTFYAKWTTASYGITYILDRGTNNNANPANYTIESPGITLAVPSRSGYDFGGWYDNADFTGSAVTMIPAGSTEDKTFYAKWIPGASIQIYLQPVPDDPELGNISLFKDEEISFTAETEYTTYQWYWNGEIIADGTSGDYTLAANSQLPGIYELSVKVTNSMGQTLSARCRVTVKDR
jgi:uncharacterized repeat protein (TIGR02543 family)